MLVLAAACIAAVCLALGSDGQVQRLCIAILAALLGGSALAAWRAQSRGLQPAPALGAFAAMLAFFSVMAAVLVALGDMIGLGRSPALAGGGVAAWIAGFLTPGAPGGLGIREAAMVIVGAGASADKLLMLGVLLRVVTFGGDLVCAVAGRALPVAPHPHI